MDFSDRLFWWSLRRALLAICAAIERRFGPEPNTQETQEPPEKSARS